MAPMADPVTPPYLHSMHRRELLELLAGAALTPALAPLSATRRLEVAQAIHARIGASGLKVLTPAQDALVTRIAEMIIPQTDTPGATSVRVNEFIDLLLDGWYDEEERARFLNGLTTLETETSHEEGKLFVESRPETQGALLTRWDTAKRDPESAAAAFRRLKELTIFGYFTSEIVMKEVTKPVIFHPSFEGCVPFTRGAR
jgi:glucoside 3-dehydrogenase (cytochrome c) hitch-hiker subunit